MTETGLSAGDAARRLGVAVTTLRTWHQRYGLGPLGYAPGHHRRYQPQDMSRLEAMQRLTSAGVPAAQAARQVLAADSTAAGTAADPASANGAAVTMPAEMSRAGGGHVIPTHRASSAARGLARAAMRLDTIAMIAVINVSIADHGVVYTWDHLVRPVLAGVSERQQAASPQSTPRLIDVEHVLSRSISEAFAAVPRPPNPTPPRALLACANDEQHTLPLEALAAALAERGATCRQLGARVPPEALESAVQRTGPAAVAVWSQTGATGDPGQLVNLLTVRPRPMVIAAAGPGWSANALPAAIAKPANLAEALELALAVID